MSLFGGDPFGLLGSWRTCCLDRGAGIQDLVLADREVAHRRFELA